MMANMTDYGIGMRYEITSLEGNNLTYTLTAESAISGEETYSWTTDIESGYWQLGIPPDSNAGDKVRPHEDSPVLQGIIERTYAGKTRQVLFLEEEQDWDDIGIRLVKTYWDKKTGILLEWWTSSDGYFLTGTNAWDNENEPEQRGIPGFPILTIVLGVLLSLFILKKIQS